jgi:hypothetical protein
VQGRKLGSRRARIIKNIVVFSVVAIFLCVCQMYACLYFLAGIGGHGAKLPTTEQKSGLLFLFFGKTLNSFSKPQKIRKEKTAVFFTLSLEKP